MHQDDFSYDKSEDVVNDWKGRITDDDWAKFYIDDSFARPKHVHSKRICRPEK